MSQWNRNTVPKCKENECSDEVLVTVQTDYNFAKVIRAVYFPYHHCSTEDIPIDSERINDEWERVENEKWCSEYWIPEGWYEVCDYDDEGMYFPITDKVIAWTKLPQPYKPTICKMR